jgi:hypothetical protein
MFPSKGQWKKWSLPNKLTAVGAYVGILGLALTLVLFTLSHLAREGAIDRKSPLGIRQSGDRSSIAIDNESLHFRKSRKAPCIFSGTVHPPDLCQKVRVSVKRQNIGRACFNREPICNNGKWKVECTDELEYLNLGNTK